MKLQSDLHVCNEPAAASLQRFNMLGPLLEHETFWRNTSYMYEVFLEKYSTAKCHPKLFCQIDKICFSNQKKNMQSNMQHHMSYYAVMQIGKYLWSKPQQVHIVWILKLAIYEIQILRNTKFGLPPSCPSHRCLMRRGTPLTRSWFMPALNTQWFATVLTHQLTWFSHAESHYRVTVYQSDVKSELKVFARKISSLLGLLFSP